MVETIRPDVNGDGQILLKLEGICKSFPGVRALHDVHMEVRRGEVHALLGENGAGKSTLMKILSGAYTRDAGEIYWEGRPIVFRHPREAQDLGIGIIYQEFNLVPQLSIAENVWIGREPFRNRALQLIDWKEMRRRTQDLLDELHLQLDPRRPVAGLGVAQQQMVEIAKALSLNAKLLIMDEPTSALTDTEINQLFALIRRLKARGVSVVFISHHLDEVFEICDRGTVLRDGEYITTVELSQVKEDDIIRFMVGRNLDQQYPKAPTKRGVEALRVEGLNQDGVLHDINFTAYTGEILGIAGLVGAGRTELVRAVFGADPINSGRVFVLGKQLAVKLAAGRHPRGSRSAARRPQTAGPGAHAVGASQHEHGQPGSAYQQPAATVERRAEAGEQLHRQAENRDARLQTTGAIPERRQSAESGAGEMAGKPVEGAHLRRAHALASMSGPRSRCTT